jgi:hypothetical protein
MAVTASRTIVSAAGWARWRTRVRLAGASCVIVRAAAPICAARSLRRIATLIRRH